jgi:Protein of unknown function (DUF1573)
MRLIAAIAIYVICSTKSFGQLAEPLLFQEKIHDFGEILEQNGNADHRFVFTNNSGRPIRIISVQASCGCTTPDWTKETIAHGKTGFVAASFDPKGRPGYFNKSLTIATNLPNVPIILQVKGTVVSALSMKVESLTASNGSLKFRNNSFNVGKIFINKESAPSEYAIVNEGKKTIHFDTVVSPKYIQVTVPDSLGPGARGVVKISYNAKIKNQFGFQSDNIEIITDDAISPIKSFSVYATIEEFFAVLGADELAKAPVLAFENYELDFLRIRQGPAIENSISFKNTGKKNLELRYIQGNCSCVVASTDKQTLKPGESATLVIKFITEGRAGTQNKAVTVYSNDPRNPVQRITITGYVED